MTRMKWLIAVFAVVFVSTAGCATVQNAGTVAIPTWNHRLAVPSSFELSVLPESMIDGAAADGFNLTAEEVGADQILVSVNVDGAQGLKALYFELAYDPAEVRPLTATATEAMGGQQDLLELTSLKE